MKYSTMDKLVLLHMQVLEFFSDSLTDFGEICNLIADTLLLFQFLWPVPY